MRRVGALIVLSLFANAGYRARMPAPVDLTPAAPEDLADARLRLALQRALADARRRQGLWRRPRRSALSSIRASIRGCDL